MSLAKCERCGKYSIGSICERCRSQPDPKQYPLSSGARAAFEHGYAEGAKDSAPQPDPKDPAETFRQGWEAGCANHRDLLKQLREGAARFEELERQEKHMHGLWQGALTECDRLQKRVEELEASRDNFRRAFERQADDATRLEAERDQLRAEIKEARGAAYQHLQRYHDAILERDAYKRAKEENDERYMIERDEARQERDAARAELAAEALASTTAGTSNSRSETAGNEPTSVATPHLKNTDISCDQGGETSGGSDGK